VYRQATTTGEATVTQQQDKATDAYAALMLTIGERLEAIETALTDRVGPDDVNWGLVGSLGYVNEQLGEIVSFLTGEDEA
jgi:hypothetical protein